jgi:hypothetical protein
MTVKIPGATSAVGYWGNSMRCRISQDQTVQKMRALLQDQLLGGGLKVDLWMSVHDVRDGEVAASGTLRCTCVKTSGEHADRRCFSCHGIGYVPGYLKFGYNTIWVSSASPGLTLHGTQINTVLKPNRYELQNGVLSGTIETPDLLYTRELPDFTWEARSDGVVKDNSAAGITVEFSVDHGAT